MRLVEHSLGGDKIYYGKGNLDEEISRRSYSRRTKRIQSSLDALNSTGMPADAFYQETKARPPARDSRSQLVANLIGPGSNPLVRLSSNIDDVSASRTPLVALSRTRNDRHFASSARLPVPSVAGPLTHLARLSRIDLERITARSQCRDARHLVRPGVRELGYRRFIVDASESSPVSGQFRFANERDLATSAFVLRMDNSPTEHRASHHRVLANSCGSPCSVHSPG